MEQENGDFERKVRTHLVTSRQIGGFHTSEARLKQSTQSVSRSSTSSASNANSTESSTAVASSSSSSSSSSTVTSNVKSTTSRRELVSQSSSSSLTSSSARMRRPALELKIGTNANVNSIKSFLVDETNKTDQGLGAASGKTVASTIQHHHQHQHHSRRSFSSSSSSCSTSRSIKATADAATLERDILDSRHAGSSTSTGSQGSTLAASLSSHQHHEAVSATSEGLSASRQSSSCQQHFRTTSSLVLSGPNERCSLKSSQSPLFSSPDVRSLMQKIDSEFAELEKVSVNFNLPATGRADPGAFKQLPSGRMLSFRKVQPLNSPRNVLAIEYDPTETKEGEVKSKSESKSDNSQRISQLQNNTNELLSENGNHCSGDRIRELMNKAKSHAQAAEIANYKDYQYGGVQDSGNLVLSKKLDCAPLQEDLKEVNKSTDHSPMELHQAAMNESIEKIDQRMSNLCKKLHDCLASIPETIELLNIMIQMIEKAWAVPVCGDDLGFLLCNSIRAAGGLDIILGFIQRQVDMSSHYESTPNEQQSGPGKIKQSSAQLKNNRSANPLRLNLSNIKSADSPPSSSQVGGANSAPVTSHQTVSQQDTSGSEKFSPVTVVRSSPATATTTKDNDSDILTSDLGLDSTSMDSISFMSANQQPDTATDEDGDGLPISKDDVSLKADLATLNDKDDPQESESSKDSAEDSRVTEREELVYLSARLLSQCLTLENRNYLVEIGLNSVIKLACNFTTMKTTQSHRLLNRSRLVSRQASNVEPLVSSNGTNSNEQNLLEDEMIESNKTLPEDDSTASKDLAQADDIDMHATIGTEILQHLFKHSEETCSTIIALGGLQAILYACRSSNLDTLRHCASALANLALYGGRDSQQTMIEQQAHVWLFPLAFNEDDNVQYYACLAIVVLAANQEIEADVLKSGTLDLVDPFLISHEPKKFAESTTAHIHGQSASWLSRLVPLLKSKRDVARNLACFHFAMEAYIKREQGQTSVFKEIGAIEPLRKCGSSPIAIESKFACQALRLIGEKEPHKLSQQIPLWTNDDVVEWLGQIGFERFREAFVESRVDGDLLLQLDDHMLNSDIGINNGIIRRRFLRELSNLKRIADYTSVDKTNLTGALSTGRGCEFIQYIYPLIQLGVTRDNIHLLDGDQLVLECQVTNAVHRLKLAEAIKNLQDQTAIAGNSSECSSYDGLLGNQKTLDVFVSYRRATGSQLASLLKVHLQLRGFSVFIDVERLEAGKFDNNLLDSIKSAKNFILVLSPNALDRCIGDHECKDWVHKEIVAALASNCNIIPIIDNFHWPDPEQLPEDMRSISYFNGIRWIHDYQDACVDKVERFIRGEIYNSANQSSVNTAPGSTSTANGVVALTQASQRLTSSVTTPSMIATPSSFGHSRAVTPFDSDHHPLSCYANQSVHLHQHHQSYIPSSPAMRLR